MGRANVEQLVRLYECWNARDLESCVAMHHPEFEMLTSGTFPDLDSVYKGRDGFRRFWNDFNAIWERLVITTQQVVDVGDRIVALWIFDGEGRDGLRVRREGAHVVTFRDGLVARMEVYGSWDSAREASERRA